MTRLPPRPLNVSLNAEQIKALRAIQRGEAVRPIVIQRLVGLGLIKQTQGVWALTEEGVMRIQASR